MEVQAILLEREVVDRKQHVKQEAIWKRIKVPQPTPSTKGSQRVRERPEPIQSNLPAT